MRVKEKIWVRGKREHLTAVSCLKRLLRVGCFRWLRRFLWLVSGVFGLRNGQGSLLSRQYRWFICQSRSGAGCGKAEPEKKQNALPPWHSHDYPPRMEQTLLLHSSVGFFRIFGKIPFFGRNHTNRPKSAKL
jgi:hypothetical protein